MRTLVTKGRREGGGEKDILRSALTTASVFRARSRRRKEKKGRGEKALLHRGHHLGEGLVGARNKGGGGRGRKIMEERSLQELVEEKGKEGKRRGGGGERRAGPVMTFCYLLQSSHRPSRKKEGEEKEKEGTSSYFSLLFWAFSVLGSSKGRGEEEGRGNLDLFESRGGRGERRGKKKVGFHEAIGTFFSSPLSSFFNVSGGRKKERGGGREGEAGRRVECSPIGSW